MIRKSEDTEIRCFFRENHLLLYFIMFIQRKVFNICGLQIIGKIMKCWIRPAERNWSVGEITFWCVRTLRSSGKTPHDHKAWKQKNGHYHRSAKGGGEWEFFSLPDEWAIHYTLPFQKAVTDSDPLTFHLKPFSFKHTGLFPEQAVNWDWFSGLIHNAGRPVKVLNLFAYTGGATVSAAAAGAAVTHVDASKGMVGWAKENAAASGLADAPIRWLVDDCMKFVEREIRRGNKYDGIIMDPPSYGRGPKGEIWKIEDNIWDFVGLTAQLLSDDALFFLINSYTTGLQPAVLSYMMNSTLTKKFGGHVEAEEIGLPVTESGLVLPCGASGRWQRK